MTRTAIVTGAARGIGAATAQRLAADGNAVAVLDLDEAQCAQTVGAITDAGGRALAVGANVADAASVERAVARIAEELGAPTILVNNAGIIRDNLLFKMTEDDWDAVLAVHLRGAFLMSRAVQEHQVKANWGRIVNLSSTSALGNRGQANYAAAKAGMQGFTKTLAIELGRYGVTANAIAPGFIVTDMTRATAERIGVPFEDFVAHTAKEIPVQRAGYPEDIAAAASFFCSEEAGLRVGPGAVRRRGSARMSIVVDSPAALADAVGSTATGDWFAIDQQRIQAFADATEDWQWIHLDADRAASGPFGATIAHGYLTLSLLPRLTAGLLSVDGAAMVVNYGLDKVRFLQPVVVDSRVRAVTEVASAEPTPQGYRVGLRTTVELEGSERPALVAETVALFVPESLKSSASRAGPPALRRLGSEAQGSRPRGLRRPHGPARGRCPRRAGRTGWVRRRRAPRRAAPRAFR